MHAYCILIYLNKHFLPSIIDANSVHATLVLKQIWALVLYASPPNMAYLRIKKPKSQLDTYKRCPMQFPNHFSLNLSGKRHEVKERSEG